MPQYVEIDSLQDLIRFLGSSNHVEESLNKIIHSCLKVAQAKRGTIVLYETSTLQNVKTLVRNAGDSFGAIDHQLNQLVSGKIMSSDSIFLTNDILREFNYGNPPKHLEDYGPSLAVPLVYEGKKIGVLHLSNGKGGPEFGQNAIELITIIALLSAQFIHKTQLHETLFEDNKRLKEEIALQNDQGTIVGNSAGLQEVFRKISLLSSSDATVLLVGESGTGKELIARAIHYHSARARKPFIAINCAAIPATLFESELFGHEKGAFTGAITNQLGKFELANEGTLFLDEISEMPNELQPKLLRVLESKKFYRVGSHTEVGYDVRVIAATSQNLEEAVNSGKFREALFHRLNVIPLLLPPLRERKEDIPLIANHYLREFSHGTKTFKPDALQFLQSREWKGNIRELKNSVERISIFIRSKEITLKEILDNNVVTNQESLPDIHSALSRFLAENELQKDMLEEVEKILVQIAMRQSQGNVSQAAKVLGIDRNALQRRIDKYGTT